jgi:hypothetical protein
MRDDDNDPIKCDDGRAKPTRGNRGRWLKGHCPNPKGRPRKKPKEYLDLADIQTFGNTLIEVRTNDGVEFMDRRAALLHKMFEDAMRGKVSMQRMLYAEFKRNDERLATARLQYDNLMTRWAIENDDFDGLDGDNIPSQVQMEILGLQSLLHHYFPSQYPNPSGTATNGDAD